VTVSEGQKVEPAVSFIHLIKRRELKQLILEAVTKAQEKSPPGTGALIVESQRRNFVKSFDAIENCQQREIFDAIETAFQLGKYAATVDIVTEKKVERARQKIRQGVAIQAKKSKADQTEQAVREVMDADPTITGSEKYVLSVKPKVDDKLPWAVSEGTILRYMKKVARGKNQDHV
jgi:vacuolar-type H+-ATPase catalytic subunit A/Vma1